MDFFVSPPTSSQHENAAIHYPFDIRERFIALLLYEAFSDQQKLQHQTGIGTHRMLSVEDMISVEMGEVFRNLGGAPPRYYDRNNIRDIVRSGIRPEDLTEHGGERGSGVQKIFKDVLHVLFHMYQELIPYWETRGRKDTLEWWGYERWGLKPLIAPSFVGPDCKDCNWIAIGDALEKRGKAEDWPNRQYTPLELQCQVRSDWAFYFMENGTARKFFGRCQKLQPSPEDQRVQESSVNIFPAFIPGLFRWSSAIQTPQHIWTSLSVGSEALNPFE